MPDKIIFLEKFTPHSVNWESSDSCVLINPRTPLTQKEKLKSLIEEHQLKSHIFLLTSGSTASTDSNLKWVALAKSAILASSQAVNEHLCCTKNDVILNPLPFFHIGGLSIFSRAYLSEAKVMHTYSENTKWDSAKFLADMNFNKVTLTSLVPTQVFDLVRADLKAPPTLRHAVVGGGSLAKDIFIRAQQLGWNLLPSYGMTECSSQIATAQPDFSWEGEHPALQVLPHTKVTTDVDGRINISGDSLLTGYIMQNNAYPTQTLFFDPKVAGRIQTSDLGKLIKNSLYIYGRADDAIKIGGETVSLTRLDCILENIKILHPFSGDLALFPVEDKRLGHKICLAVAQNENKEMIDNIVNQFNLAVFPFEKIRDICCLQFIPRTELGKLKRSVLSKIKYIPE